ncbi:ubiquitin-conjugating enzyme E2 [Musa troglodytarum]|uniref:Ubiquitin-conjugating enzyme E2 n=1 Tax=Musa troglodytarum TaxID=320322 RepID=A0A9E7JRL5_9LILI|nr:ubiquitin-conjugating enzyme E2 [Musa troglodytarum]
MARRPPRAGFKLISSDCPQRGIIEVIGAPGTLHENEKCQLQISFPEQYPQEAPEVSYISASCAHPHVYNNGHTYV